jgi:hypothetical protein
VIVVSEIPRLTRLNQPAATSAERRPRLDVRSEHRARPAMRTAVLQRAGHSGSKPPPPSLEPHRRRLTILGLVLTIAALVAPSANAKMRPVYSDHGVALIASSSESNPNLACSDQGCTPIQPDSKSKPNLACSSQGCTEITPPQSEPTPIPNVSDNPSGFDWSKTGFIVSLSLVGLLLLGGGALLAGKHNRRRRRRLAAA